VLAIYFYFNSRNEKRIINLFKFAVIFALLASPFFIANYFIFGDALHMISEFQNYLHDNLASVYSLKTYPSIPKLFFVNTDFLYFKSVLYLFNVLLPFMFYGVYKIFKKNYNPTCNKRMILLLIPVIILFLLVEISSLKQERYLLPIFPMLAIFCALGLSKLKKKHRGYVLLGMYILGSLAYSGIFLNNSYNGEKGYVDFFYNPPINISCSSVVSTDPRTVIIYKTLFPYNVFDKEYILKENPECIFYFSCYEKRSEQITNLENLNYSLQYSKDTGRCLYAIFKNNSFLKQ
jgi:hypothetical protein